MLRCQGHVSFPKRAKKIHSHNPCKSRISHTTCVNEEARRGLMVMCPREFHHVITDEMDDATVSELNCIRSHYNTPLDTAETRIALRGDISKIVKSRNDWSEIAMEYFIWLLMYYYRAL